MDKKDNSKALLPNGFADLMPPFAENEANAIQLLMDKFASFGYRRIKPPLLEFEDSLLDGGIGSILASDTFRLMDPVSRRMLGLRSDVTPQISRIVSSRLKNEVRPLRLAYASDVLRVSGSQMRSERQFTQVGCELVAGDNGCDSDIEICVLAILGLKSLGINDITLDLTIPKFVSHILNDAADMGAIEKAIKQRDIDALMSLDSKTARILAQAMAATGAASKALPMLEAIKFDSVMRGKIKHLKHVNIGVEKALSELGITDTSLSIDVLEQTGFEYHNGLGFTIFARNSRGELGRGGSYDLDFDGNENGEIARGFTLYMDSILQIIPHLVEKNHVFVLNGEPWSVISKLQNDGWVVVRGASPNDECTHIYENDKIMKIN